MPNDEMKKSNKMPTLHLHRALRQVSSVNTATSSFNELQVHNTQSHKKVWFYGFGSDVKGTTSVTRQSVWLKYAVDKI